MKIITSTLLLILLTYIAMPTLSLVADKSFDIEFFEDFSEECESEKEYKIVFNFVNEFSLNVLNFKAITSKIVSTCKFKHEIISSKIFIPPPELV